MTGKIEYSYQGEDHNEWKFIVYLQLAVTTWELCRNIFNNGEKKKLMAIIIISTGPLAWPLNCYNIPDIQKSNQDIYQNGYKSCWSKKITGKIRWRLDHRAIGHTNNIAIQPKIQHDGFLPSGLSKGVLNKSM